MSISIQESFESENVQAANTGLETEEIHALNAVFVQLWAAQHDMEIELPEDERARRLAVMFFVAGRTNQAWNVPDPVVDVPLPGVYVSDEVASMLIDQLYGQVVDLSAELEQDER